MNASIALRPTTCAFCDTLDNAIEVYTANLHGRAFNPAVFSARRLPDRLHYRVVRCNVCGLLRSDPIAAPELLKQLYSQSDQNYEPELGNIRLSYGRYLAHLDRFGVKKESLLEIGCGSGFFLEEAKLNGFRDLWGVEPSEAAATKAIPEVRGRILCDVLRPGLFEDSQFDVICMFQVFDHLPDPNTSLEVCFRFLKPGGLILALNHDAASLSVKLLGERSPIVDIEHTYLYDRKSMAAMFEKHGFQILRTGSAFNQYSLQYLLQLTPFPRAPKMALLDLLRRTGIGPLSVTVGLGNLFLIATKPVTA
jgi:SAM-dependent methyltransferase